MKCNSDKSLRFVLILGLISLGRARPQDIDIDGFEERDYDKGCSYLHCERGKVCVDRRLSCKKPPCPRMLFCARTRKDFVRGPATCDFARCTRGHVCVVKVRRCHWDEKCAQQIARCVSEKDQHDNPASCAGFSCPAGDHCILKETDCLNPPCQLSRSCERSPDVQAWHAKCRSLNCPSEYECFLRKAEENSPSVPCNYIPDCTTTIEDELRSEYCQGWICPRYQKCVAKVVGSCEENDCDIMRSCQSLQMETEQTLVPHYRIAEETSLHQSSGRMETTYTPSEEFQNWLESVKATLGSDTYNRWLDYIHHSANSEWILIPRSILSVGPRSTLNVGEYATEAQSVKQSLLESKGIQNSDTAPSVIAISNFETQTENNNSSLNDSECECTNSKFHYNNLGKESESNGTSDESLDRLNVSELLDMIDEIITILNSSSNDDAIKGMITQGDPLSSNIQHSEAQNKMTHPLMFSSNISTQEHKYSELPSEQNPEKNGLIHSTSESYRYRTKTHEEFADRLSGEEQKRIFLPFFKPMTVTMNKSCNPSNGTDCAVQQFYEAKQNNTERSKAAEEEFLYEQTKEPPQDEKEENGIISRTNSTTVPGQPSFGNLEQISRTAHPIYRDKQTGPRAAYTLPSYGALYNGNSSYGDYEFYNSPHENINVTNPNLDT